MDGKVSSISIFVPDGECDAEEAREEVTINIPEDFANSKLKEMLMHHYANKEVSEDIVNGSGEVLVGAGAALTEADIDRILQDGTVTEVSVRNNEIDGIEIEASRKTGRKSNPCTTVSSAGPWRKISKTRKATCCSTSMNILRKTWQIRLR